MGSKAESEVALDPLTLIEKAFDMRKLYFRC